MNRCSRNILFIFGYLLIIAVFFVPCENQSYFYVYNNREPLDWLAVDHAKLSDIKGDVVWDDFKDRFVFLPVYIYRQIKYRQYVKWHTVLKDNYDNQISRHKQTLINEFEKEDERNPIKMPEKKGEKNRKESFEEYVNRKYLEEKDSLMVELRNDDFELSLGYGRIREVILRLVEFAQELNKKTKSEFIERFGADPTVSVMKEIYVVEIVSILLVAGFAYILFCVVLRKPKKIEGL
jgi:hypothetical protein